MKILHVNYYDRKGGAGRASARLHESLQQIGVDSQMLVHWKIGRDQTVDEVHPAFRKTICRVRSVLDALPLKVYPAREQAHYSVSWVPSGGLVRKINRSGADIVHLHWIVDGMMRIEDLNRINKPLVWSLHDMWAFTGGCHYSGGCHRYREICGSCPVLGSETEQDLSRKVFERKKKVYEDLNLTVVGLSNWIAESARESSLFEKRKVVQLPNPIDTDLFRPVEQNMARKMLDLPGQAKLVLFGAIHATRDPRKGYRALRESLKFIGSPDAELVIYGSEKSGVREEFGFRIHSLGKIEGDDRLRAIYCAADVTVVPSRQENLSNIIMESLSCGTPVAAFDRGGNADLIEHKVSGYLARPEDPSDLAQGIDWILQHPEEPSLSKAARNRVMERFKSDKVAREYAKLYLDILKGTDHRS